MRPTAALLLSLLLAQAPTAHGQAALTSAPLSANCRLPPGPLPERTRAVFLLDTSGSMRGIGDGKANIFQAVKNSIDAYVHAQQPDRAVLVTFDTGIRSQRAFDAPATNPAWTAHLRGLSADGRNTFLYGSMQAALRPLNAAEGYITTVFVLTDGIDNETPRTHTAQAALDSFTGRGPLDRLHYVALGTDIPANARRALEATTYADGLTLPVGRIPDLSGAGLEGGVLNVTDPARIPVTFPDGTALIVDSGTQGDRVRLARPTVQAGHAALTVRGVPYGTPALLCAASLPALPGGVGTRSSHVLLRLNVGEAPRLTWLNPGADLKLDRGEHVILRYRAHRSVNLDRLTLGGLPAGLLARVGRTGDSREISVRLQNTGLKEGETATGTLNLPRAAPRPLPTITAGTATGTVPTPGVSAPEPDTTRLTVPPASNQSPTGRPLPAWLPGLLGTLAVLGLLNAALPHLRRFWAARQAARRQPRPTPAAPPTIEGLEYTEDRAVRLVTAHGESMTLTAPLGGPFDIGHHARVPHLSGLRVQQAQGGLHLLHVPADLEVSQGARLLRAGDTVRPGTLLGLAVARPARAPHASLGDLAGLGLPLTIQADGVTVHLKGPYGQHALTLPGGVTDLGETLRSPALHGLRLGTSGPRVLIVETRAPLSLWRPGDPDPLKPGTHLPSTPTELRIEEN